MQIIMSKKYDVVVTNPPYMGLKKMPSAITDFVISKYSAAKQDLATVFILKALEYVRPNGLISLITQHGWMFQSSYEKLRDTILHNSMINMAHLGAGAFEEISGEVVQTTAFVIKKAYCRHYVSTIERVVDIDDKECGLVSRTNEKTVCSEQFMNVPGKVYAYWLTDSVIKAFKNNLIGTYVNNFQGIIPGKQDYLKLWHEVPFNRIHFQDTDASVLKHVNAYYPYAKGGSFRRWYGNNNYVLKWSNDGKNFVRSRTENRNLFFKGGITWSDISTGLFCARQFDDGQLFDAAGPVIIPINNHSFSYIIAFMNTVVFQSLIDIVCQGLHYGNGAVTSRPIIFSEDKEDMVSTIVTENISISKADWDVEETSWDFRKNVLV